MREDVPAITRRRRGQELHAEMQEAFFRRRPEAPRRRRRRPVLAFLGRALRVGVVLAVPVTTAVWALTSPVFALGEVEYVGLERVPRSWLDQRLADYRGDNLITLPLDRVREQLGDHEWIQGVRLRKSLPDRLAVEVVEYRPSARLQSHEGEFWLTEGGYVISEVSEGEPSQVRAPEPEVVVIAPEGWAETAEWLGTTPAAVRAALGVAARLVGAPGGLDRELSAVAILGRDDFELRLAHRPFVVRVTSSTGERELEVFDRLLPQIVERYRELGVVDLRFSRRIVLKPSGERFPDPLESTEQHSAAREVPVRTGSLEPQTGFDATRG